LSPPVPHAAARLYPATFERSASTVDTILCAVDAADYAHSASRPFGLSGRGELEALPALIWEQVDAECVDGSTIQDAAGALSS